MPVPASRLPLDSGPLLPKSRGAHAMGSGRHMLDHACVECDGDCPSSAQSHVHSDLLDAADAQNSDDMGTCRVLASTSSDGDCSSLPGRHHLVGHIKPGSGPTSTSTSSLTDRWVNYLRNRDRQSEHCSEIKPGSRDRFSKPYAEEQPLPGDEDKQQPRRRSPPPVDSPHFQRLSSPANNRSRARNDQGRPRKITSGSQLWTSDDEPGPKAPPSQLRRAAPIRSPQSPSDKAYQTSSSITPPFCDDDSTSAMIPQPETRPISQDQLVAEVKGIYAGLVMVETKCIEVDNAKALNTDTNTNPKLNNDQWQALIALHRTLLHEHHDFFLASQHPSASPALRRLASKYAMPARMWRHGIHSFLELLSHRSPASLEHMLTFLYLAYSIVSLLYATVPAFEDTWIECLGGLGRYRMAIEDDDMRDREIWTGVSRNWYAKASDRSPTTGRLYHHLAILARPHALQQLSYYTKSLCALIPFPSARESIMTLFDPVISASSTSSRLATMNTAFVKAHGILFSGKSQDRLQESMDEFLEQLDPHISKRLKRWLEPGYYIGVSTAPILLAYGDLNHVQGFASVPTLLPSLGSDPLDLHPNGPLYYFLRLWKRYTFFVLTNGLVTLNSGQILDDFLRPPLPEDWIPGGLAPTLGKKNFKLRLRHLDGKPRASERRINRTHNPIGFSPGAESVEATSEELLLPAGSAHLHEMDCVAVEILASFRIILLASLSNLYLLFGGLERALSCHCSGDLPASSLL